MNDYEQHVLSVALGQWRVLVGRRYGLSRSQYDQMIMRHTEWFVD